MNFIFCHRFLRRPGFCLVCSRPKTLGFRPIPLLIKFVGHDENWDVRNDYNEDLRGPGRRGRWRP